VAPLPNRLKPREVAIERASHPNRFQAQWLIFAYEKIVPSSPQRGPSLAPPPGSLAEAMENVNDMKGTI
jgi:hypothetical protein